MEPDLLFPNPFDSLTPWTVVLVACALGCFTDLRARKLPNLLTLPLWVAGLVYSAIVAGLPGLAGSFMASVLLALPFIILFLCAGGGAGDAKMMAGVGAWLGLSHGVPALVAVALAGGVVGLAFSLLRGEARRTFTHLATATTGLMGVAFGRLRFCECLGFMPPGASAGARRIPYGVAIFAGVTLAFLGAVQWHA
jgi:prepilin peptidase CpaA